MKKISLLFVSMVIAMTYSFAQYEIGGEYLHGFSKKYPANQVGINYESFNNTGKTSFNAGLNYTFSQGWGVHAGVHYNFNFSTSGNIYSGVRVGLLFKKDGPSTVLVPGLEAGYHYTFNKFGPGGYVSPGVAVVRFVDFGGSKRDDKAFEDDFAIFAKLGMGIRF